MLGVAQQKDSVGLRSAWSAQWVPGQRELHCENLSQKQANKIKTFLVYFKLDFAKYLTWTGKNSGHSDCIAKETVGELRKDLSDEQVVHHNIHVISLTYSLTFQKTYLIEQVAILLGVFSIRFNIYREKYPWLSVLPNTKTRNYLGFRSHFQHWNSVFLFFRMATFWSKW